MHPLDAILNFLSAHFEELVLLNVFALVLSAIVVIAASFRRPSKKAALRFINNFLFIVLVGGEAILFILMGYIYWLNYKTRPLLPIEERLVYRTDWAKDRTEVFYISGPNLYSIRIDGTDSRTIFKAEQPIREYHFSPNGRYLVVVTDNSLHLVDQARGETRLIEKIPPETEGQYVLRAVSWAPDSKKFAYEKAFWTSFSSQSRFSVYNIADVKTFPLRTAMHKISFLFWDRKSDALYFFQQQARDPSEAEHHFWIKLYKIPLKTLEPEYMAQRPAKQFDLNASLFTSLGADIFYEGAALSFDRIEDGSFWISPEGASLGIDEDDYLYYLKGRWWRKRLFKVPRDPVPGEIPRYQYAAGPLAIRHVRWLPGDKYVIMDHKVLGILILDPSTGRLGQLTYTPGHTFGWYRPVNRSSQSLEQAIARLRLKPPRRGNVVQSIEKLQKRISGHH